MNKFPENRAYCSFGVNLRLTISDIICYNDFIVGFFRKEGGGTMEYLVSFLLSVAASVIGSRISKWLDDDKHDN